MANYNKSIEREEWADFVRVVATFMVVLLHSCGIWLKNSNNFLSFDWQFANFLNSSVRVSVPLFFMLTGYLFFTRPIDYGSYYKKRLSRIVIPLIFWSVVYFIYESLLRGKFSILFFFLSLINGNVSFHLWFLYVLAGLYLFIPVLSSFFLQNTRERAIYFLTIWFFSVALLPFLGIVSNQVFSRELKSIIDLSGFSGYSGFLVLGLFIGQRNTSTMLKWGSLFVLAFGILFTAFATAYISNRTGAFYDYFYGYLTPNVILMSGAAFFLLKSIGQVLCNSFLVSSVIKNLGKASFGIYLVHPLILDLISRDTFCSFLTYIRRVSSLTIPLIAVMGFIMSFAVVYIIQKNPQLRKIV